MYCELNSKFIRHFRIRGLRSFMCCELISALVVLLISIPYRRPIINFLIQCLAHRLIIPCVGVQAAA